MSDFDDRLRAELQRLAAPGDPSGVYDRVHERKVKRRIMRRLEAATLAVVVVGGTAGGGYALTRAFGIGERREAPRPAAAIANGKIAFVRSDGGRPDIFVMNQDGTGGARLTTDPADDVAPAWSPDGTRIAFVHVDASYRFDNGEINVVADDGGDPTRIGNGMSPAWSPDGRRIAFVGVGLAGLGERKLKTMNSDGSEVVTLLEAAVHLGPPTWSPDGQRIAYTDHSEAPCPSRSGCWTSFGVGIYVLRANGSSPGRLSSRPIGARQAAWAPDGNRIAYSDADPAVAPCPSPVPGTAQNCPTGPPPQLNVMRIDGSTTRLTELPDGANNPAWSPDGTQIVFDSGGDIYVMDADGANLRQLTSGPELDSDPAWQPVVVGSTWTPSEGPSPSENLSPSGSPPPGQSPSPSPAPCTEPPVSVYQSHVSGDFDGDGIPEFVFVDRACLPVGDVARLGWVLGVTWSSGTQASTQLTDCSEETCRAYSAADLNGDGIDEFVLLVDEGASTRFVEMYELNAGEGSGQRAAKVLAPGAEAFIAGEPAQFAVSGSVAHQDLVTCDTVAEKLEVFATSAVLSRDQTEYLVHETGLVFDPAVDPPYGAFRVESVRDYRVPFDPSGQTVIPAPGEPCFTEYPG